jgi:hypothetical protein
MLPDSLEAVYHRFYGCEISGLRTGRKMMQMMYRKIYFMTWLSGF